MTFLKISLKVFYYRRQISPQTVQAILQSHAEGSSIGGLSHITGVIKYW
ncbi:hypothetical protein AM1_6017 [Acaryochloris marina MBIC11017]|uniref:Uncharacterized protein n=1 Tax=Acaryochloris marina (strain MBIC 11017) TaxID=329726 RepID=B0C2R1_ACAM1|nr:hypothetical protein AM1_6017 [Acaryochloris marina MBIC11017]